MKKILFLLFLCIFLFSCLTQIDIKEFNKFLESLDPIDPNSEEISRENVYIPEDGNSPELKKRTILDFLFDSPLTSFKKIKSMMPEMNTQTIYNILFRLEEEGVLSEITGYKRNRVYRMDKLIGIVS